MLKRVLSDPSFYLLILLNLFFIYEYKDDPLKYNTIIWVFWCQSVLIGLFNFIELLTTKNAEAKGFTINDKPVDPKKARGCYSIFFLLHYQFFHFAYFIFLVVQTGIKNVDFMFLKYAFFVLLFQQLIQFIRNKQVYSHFPPNLGNMFFLPYLRIVPMHLMILLPAFLNLKPAIVFLVLKGMFDVVGYLIVARWHWKNTNRKPVEILL